MFPRHPVALSPWTQKREPSCGGLIRKLTNACANSTPTEELLTGKTIWAGTGAFYSALSMVVCLRSTPTRENQFRSLALLAQSIFVPAVPIDSNRILRGARE